MMKTIANRLSLLENATGRAVPLYLQRWLGETLTADEQRQADAEWQGIQTTQPDPSRFTPAMQAWLSERAATA